MTLTEEQRGTVAFDLEKARAVDIDLLAATDWGELRARYRAALAEIERLRADLADSEKRNEDLRKGIDDLSTTIFSGAQATRIKELEKMVYSAIGQIAWSLSIETGRMPDKMSIDFLDWQVPPEVKKTWTDWAALHLQSEGKIGPDARPPCWQITEERVDVLGFCLSGEFDGCGCAECDHAVAVLRAMLKEAL